eukprot:gb/GECG01006904.1/.p1 GENE.gb/GECG01006904.1/~~gb/GECG01006904.1/.p1  ORF type:complete len:115 (+),score=3.07 gb/GECG01006904.1/:1-345(+)
MGLSGTVGAPNTEALHCPLQVSVSGTLTLRWSILCDVTFVPPWSLFICLDALLHAHGIDGVESRYRILYAITQTIVESNIQSNKVRCLRLICTGMPVHRHPKDALFPLKTTVDD